MATVQSSDTARLSRTAVSSEKGFCEAALRGRKRSGKWSEMKVQEQISRPGGETAADHETQALSRAPASRRSTSRTQDIDRHVGVRIRERRVMLGLTQQQLAELIGVTYQQAHKYERGINRVSAGRLFDVAQVLNVPVNYFFDGLEQEGERAISPRERMCLELARNFAQIPNERHQEALSQLARVLAAS
jgi:transcriptional regulator with XRE-family HTH domain